MITVHVRNSLSFDKDAAGPEAMRRVRAAFTHLNKEYTRRASRGAGFTGGLSRRFRTYEVDGHRVHVSRGATRELTAALAPVGVRFVDRTSTAPVEWPRYEGSLRPYQERAVAASLPGIQGVVVGPCGSGKTEILLALAARTGQRTIVAVDTKDLQRQWAERFRAKYAGSPGDVGMIGGLSSSASGYDWDWAVRKGPGRVLTVATVQTLRGDPSSLDLHGCLVADEVHLWAASTFDVAASASSCRHRYGATATLQRSDGRLQIVTHTFGPVLYEVTAEELEDSGHRRPVPVRLVRTGFRMGRSSSAPAWTDVLSSMASDPARHAVVMKTVVADAAEGPTLVLSASRVYGEQIVSELADRGLRVHSLFGGAGRPADCVHCGHVEPGAGGAKECPSCRSQKPSRASHNAAVLALLDEGRCVAVGTSVADKALDVPRLARVVVALPTAGGKGQPLSARFKQQHGRLARPDGVPPRLDYVHDHRMSFARDREAAIRAEIADVSVA